jgi:HlyD family secretion protein
MASLLGKKFVFLAALLIVVIAFGLVLLIRQPRAESFITVPIEKGRIARVVTATGAIQPVLSVLVGSYTSGVIQDVFCDYNTEVSEGQICAKIDPRPYQATLNQYFAQLLRDQAVLSKDRIDLDRYQKLAAQNSIAVQQAEDQVYIVQQDEATVKLDQALVDGAKLNLDYTNIVSPVDGVVVSRNVTKGQTVTATFQTPTLFTIAKDLREMQVHGIIDQADVGIVKVGQAVKFTVDAYPDRTFSGRMLDIRRAPQVDQNVVAYEAIISAANPDQALFPGMVATLQILIDASGEVLKIPNQALRFRPKEARDGKKETGSSATVWVPGEDGRAKPVQVTVGQSDDTGTQLLSGNLSEGQPVIVGVSNAATRTSFLQLRLGRI